MRYCVPLFDGAGVLDGAGVNGCGADEPEPVVAGGGVDLVGVLAVDVVEEPLLPVVLLLFQPAITRNPISSTTATPAIQPHIPPTASSRRITGSLNRGSVKRGSVMGILLPDNWKGGNPLAVAAVPHDLRGKNQVTRIASRHAPQKTMKKQARNTGRLAVADQCSTVRPMK